MTLASRSRSVESSGDYPGGEISKQNKPRKSVSGVRDYAGRSQKSPQRLIPQQAVRHKFDQCTAQIQERLHWGLNHRFKSVCTGNLRMSRSAVESQIQERLHWGDWNCRESGCMMDGSVYKDA